MAGFPGRDVEGGEWERAVATDVAIASAASAPTSR